MTAQEINNFADRIEMPWLENYFAKKNLVNECGFSNPEDFLADQINNESRLAPLPRGFEAAREAIGRGLRDSELYETMYKALAASAKQPGD